MKIFKRIFSLTAAVLLSVPTITAPASGAEASEDGSVEVSAVSDYSVFEGLNLLVKNFSLLNQMPYICLNLFVFPNGFSYPISWKSSFRYIAAAVPTVPTILLSPA